MGSTWFGHLRWSLGAAAMLLVAACATPPTVAPATTPAPSPVESTTSAPTTSARTTTVPGTTAPYVSVAVPPARATEPWFAATRFGGTVELWAASGRLGSWTVCDTPQPDNCGASIEAVSRDEVFMISSDANGSQLLRGPVGGGALRPVDLGLLPAGGAVTAATASADGRTLWLVYHLPAAPRSGLYRIRDGVVTTILDRGAVDVALSPDQGRLVYSHYRDLSTSGYPGRSALTIVDLATGGSRTIGHEVDDPFAPIDLAWSPDDRHVLFQFGWEGSVPMVVDVDTASTLDADAVVPPPAPREPGGDTTTPACWSSPTSVALGLWSWGVESPGIAGAIVDTDLATGTTRSRSPEVLGQSIACRADGAVATVRFPTVDGHGLDRTDPDKRCVGDLVVVRPDGTTTVLGRDYVAVSGV